MIANNGRWVTYSNAQFTPLKIPVDRGASVSVFNLPAGQALPALPNNFHDRHCRQTSAWSWATTGTRRRWPSGSPSCP
jgi:hypothetical protein